MTMTCLMVLLVALGTCFLRKYLMHTREYVAVITIVGVPNDGEYRDVTI